MRGASSECKRVAGDELRQVEGNQVTQGLTGCGKNFEFYSEMDIIERS